MGDHGPKGITPTRRDEISPFLSPPRGVWGFGANTRYSLEERRGEQRDFTPKANFTRRDHISPLGAKLKTVLIYMRLLICKKYSKA
jgi:hypothetical protein